MSYLLYLVNKAQIRLLPSQLLIRAAFEPPWRTFWGAPRIHGGFSCSGTGFPQPPSRAICLHQPDGQPSRGGASCAIKPVRLASILRRARGDAGLQVRPYWAKLMRSPTAKVATVSVDSGVASAANRPPPTLEESVCGPPGAASRDAPSASARRSIWWPPATAQQSSAHRRCGAKPTLRSSGLTKIAITRESACCFFGGPGFEKPQPSKWVSIGAYGSSVAPPSDSPLSPSTLPDCATSRRRWP